MQTDTFCCSFIIVISNIVLVVEYICFIGEEVVGYEGPRPMMGIHRIVFIVFRQAGRQTVYAPGWRQNFNTRDFSEVYNLGKPVAATYFNCKRQLDSTRRR